MFAKPKEGLNPCPLRAFLRRCLAYRMPTCQHCREVGSTKEWLFSHVLTQGRMMRLGFSSLEEFTADYKRKVSEQCKTKVQVAVVLSNEAGRRFDYEVEKARDGMAREIANLIFMVRVYVYNLS